MGKSLSRQAWGGRVKKYASGFSSTAAFTNRFEQPLGQSAAQKGSPTRPQAKSAPQAYPLGYVEDASETRTQLKAFFSSRYKLLWRIYPPKRTLANQ
jgi:hypothetical protein